MTRSQIDRLGERLKVKREEADLRLLDEYRSSFAAAYDHVLGVMRDELKLAPTGRRAKTTESIITKLKRERSRLSQLQDVAGCRIVVEDRAAQDLVIEAMRREFPDCKIVDRREKPSHGYRAVHVIVRSHEKIVEVQVRTALQHQWAEVSEKLADKHGIEVKYGAGPERIRVPLDRVATLIARVEAMADSPNYGEWYRGIESLLQDMVDI
jgi:ppGpp synthetase/RelA/SpoT-type nucleotidyltranferase